MNIQQLRAVRETIRRRFSLTVAATVLHTSQPGLSRQIRELEEELGVEIFVRAGKRLTGLTPPGASVVPMIERVLDEIENMKRSCQEFETRDAGSLSIAATHSQARYALPKVIREFRSRFPRVTLSLHQGSPKQVAELLISGEVDIGVATEALANYDQLVALPCYEWTHSIIVPAGHPLAETGKPSIAALGAYPLITYDDGFTGRSHINDGFAAAGLKPEIVLSAMDADVIKTYVELGMGVGIVAAIAFDAERDRNLQAIDAAHLFQPNLTRLAVRRGAWLPGFVYAFIEEFSGALTRAEVDRRLRPTEGDA